MSRRRIAALLVIGALTAGSSPGFAQDGATGSPPDRIDIAIEPPPALRSTVEACRRMREAAVVSGEIVVCYVDPNGSDQRITSREEAQTRYAAATMNRGLGRKPDFRPPPCRPSILTFCLKTGAPPPMAIEVDLASLPEALPGSDAGRLDEEPPQT